MYKFWRLPQVRLFHAGQVISKLQAAVDAKQVYYEAPSERPISPSAEPVALPDLLPDVVPWLKGISQYDESDSIEEQIQYMEVQLDWARQVIRHERRQQKASHQQQPEQEQKEAKHQDRLWIWYCLYGGQLEPPCSKNQKETGHRCWILAWCILAVMAALIGFMWAEAGLTLQSGWEGLPQSGGH